MKVPQHFMDEYAKAEASGKLPYFCGIVISELTESELRAALLFVGTWMEEQEQEHEKQLKMLSDLHGTIGRLKGKFEEEG